MKCELPSTELIVIEENNYLKFGEYLNDMQCDDTTNKLCLDDLKYVKKLQQENKKYKEVINKAINNSQYWIDYYTRLNSDERIALRLQENIDILKEVE